MTYFSFYDRRGSLKFMLLSCTHNVGLMKNIDLFLDKILIHQALFVQRLVNFNPGLSKNYKINFFSRKRFTVSKSCSDFQRKNLLIPK